VTVEEVNAYGGRINKTLLPYFYRNWWRIVQQLEVKKIRTLSYAVSSLTPSIPLTGGDRFAVISG
jgi:hypothetical protein